MRRFVETYIYAHVIDSDLGFVWNFGIHIHYLFICLDS